MPRMVILGDDDHLNSGPSGFPCAAKVLEWANVYTLHAAAAEVAHYVATLDAAIQSGRGLLIETGSAHAEQWWNLARQHARRAKPLLGVITRPGVPHPVMRAEVRL